MRRDFHSGDDGFVALEPAHVFLVTSVIKYAIPQEPAGFWLIKRLLCELPSTHLLSLSLYSNVLVLCFSAWRQAPRHALHGISKLMSASAKKCYSRAARSRTNKMTPPDVHVQTTAEEHVEILKRAICNFSFFFFLVLPKVISLKSFAPNSKPPVRVSLT